MNMQAINFMTTSTNLPQMDPDTYAKNYATQNGISVEEAKEQLKAQYGEPQKPQGPQDNSSIFASSDNSLAASSQFSCDFSQLEDIIGELEDEIEGSGSSTLKNLFQKFLDFLKGGFGPQKEGDPQSHLGEADRETSVAAASETETAQNQTEGRDPDKYLEKYAKENNLTIEEAKAELQNLYGAPERK